MLEFKQVSKSFRDGNQMIQAVKPTDLKIIQGTDCYRGTFRFRKNTF